MPHPQLQVVRSDRLEALEHQRAATDIAPDFTPKLDTGEKWILALCAVCILVSVGLVVALCFSTLPLPVKP